ncbi:hypothetical protein GCM10020218_092450 [Dactylosporangium vinaceum]
MKPLIVLIGTGLQDYRGYLLEEIAPALPAAPGEPGRADLGDAVPRRLHAGGRPGRRGRADPRGQGGRRRGGVLCWDEGFVLPVGPGR